MSILFTLDISFLFKYRPFKISININDYTKRRKTFNIFDFPNQLISDINAGKISSRYSHDNTITLTDGVTCLNMDCSGFACYYLQKIGQLKALQEIKDFVSQSKHIAPEDIKRIYTKEFAIFSGRLKKFAILAQNYESGRFNERRYNCFHFSLYKRKPYYDC